VAEMDKEIAGELFEEIFIFLFKSNPDSNVKELSLQSLSRIL